VSAVHVLKSADFSTFYHQNDVNVPSLCAGRGEWSGCQEQLGGVGPQGTGLSERWPLLAAVGADLPDFPTLGPGSGVSA